MDQQQNLFTGHLKAAPLQIIVLKKSKYIESKAYKCVCSLWVMLIFDEKQQNKKSLYY